MSRRIDVQNLNSTHMDDQAKSCHVRGWKYLVGTLTLAQKDNA